MRFVLYLLIVYLLGLPTVLIAGQVAESSDLIAYLKLAWLIAFALHAILLYRLQRADAVSTAAAVGCIAVLWAVVSAMYAYKVVTAMPFSFSFAISSLADTRRTLEHVLGKHMLLYLLGGAIGFAAVGGGAAWLALQAARRRALRVVLGRAGSIGCAFAIFYLVAADARYVAEELVIYPRARLSMYPFNARNYSSVPVTTGESVFVVQLESVNATAMFTRDSDGYSKRIRLPGLEKILGEGHGVFFPFFWANSGQTHRALESIMCGISGNSGPALPLDPGRLRRWTCLPRHLAEQGYTTAYLYSYFDLDFYNFGNFARRAGFHHIAYGKALMAESDPKHAWGYDDCAFYGRAFEYLGKQALAGKERLFAYFEVGMNHWPFFNTDKHVHAHPYPAPQTPLEHYLNAVAEQDHCLLQFWQGLTSLERDDIHLFIVPDHSVLVTGLPRDLESAFLTWVAYVPPRKRRHEFQPGARLQLIPSQAQIYPTVLELLGGRRTPQSFAFALRGDARPPDYDDCHLLVTSLGLVAMRNGERNELRFQSRELIGPDGSRESAGFWEFHDRFFCR